jgi:hypothetical protein
MGMIPRDMLVTPTSCRAVVLVKAVPRPSKRHGETVCCAGVTADGQWKRLFPIRFRYLRDNKFSRWDWVEFKFRRPTSDARRESCHVLEDTLTCSDKLPIGERGKLLNPIIMPSAKHAAEAGQSLALIRPVNTRFFWRTKSKDDIEQERIAYQEAISQKGFFDEDLKAIDPLPYEFRFSFNDAAGKHDWECGDWETHTTFWKWRREYGDQGALERLSGTYNDDYPQRGMVFATGNMAARPQTWQLLGVLRLDPERQLALRL